MTYKTARNKALKDCGRLITATYHDKKWSCPDGYFAIDRDIYFNYRVKNSQFAPPRMPSLDSIIDNDVAYVVADADEPMLKTILISSVGSPDLYWVNRLYYECIKAYYPNAVPHIAASGGNHQHIKVFNDGKLVAVLMPEREPQK